MVEGVDPQRCSFRELEIPFLGFAELCDQNKPSAGMRDILFFEFLI